MTLVRSMLMNALTRLVSRNAEETNINVAVAATFADPNCIVVACKQQRTITRVLHCRRKLSVLTRGRY